MKNPRISKNVAKDIKDYNEKVPPLRQDVQELQARLLLGSGWTKKDGPYPGVFDKLGVLWSVTWHTSLGVITPRTYFPLENIPVDALIFEMLEYAQLETINSSGRERLYLQFLLDLRRMEQEQMAVERFYNKWHLKISSPIREFVCTFDPPDMKYIVNVVKRPGWPDPTGLQKPPVIHIPPPVRGMKVATEKSRYTDTFFKD